MPYLSADVSEFQPVVNDSYPHRWLSFRVFDGSYVDLNYRTNLAWALHSKAVGKLAGFTVYFVWEPGDNPVARLDALNVPKDCTVMVDVESWAGRIKGDHSAELNRIVGQISDRQGSPSRVWGYANRGDFAALWPTRPPWLGLVVASYGGDRPVMTGLVGWQYTNGIYNVHGKPSASEPFGACDHNEFYIDETAETATAVPLEPAKPAPEEDMFYLARANNGAKVYTVSAGGCRWVRTTRTAMALALDPLNKFPDPVWQKSVQVLTSERMALLLGHFGEV